VATTFERVRKVVAKDIGVDEEKITLETSLTEDFPTDSLTRVEIAMNLETEFDIEIEDDVAASLDTISRIVEFVDSQTAAAV
jgi:acyl carrier protein